MCLRRRFAAEGCWERTGKCDRKSSVCESIGRVVGNVTERMIGSQDLCESTGRFDWNVTERMISVAAVLKSSEGLLGTYENV